MSVLVLCLFLIIKLLLTEAIQCVDENDKSVDWFVIYKLPKIKHKEELIKNGVGYIYLTSLDYSEWKFSNYSINDTNSILGKNLRPFYNNLTSGYIFYNDQPPNKSPNPDKGHTKGIVLTDLHGGFWLIHSVPHFPLPQRKYEFPTSGVVKGQSFLCISVDLKNLNKVGIQLQYNQPQIYASSISNVLKNKINELVKAVSGITVTKPPWYNEVAIVSNSGTRFMSYAKSMQFGKDLYEDWVAPTLQTNLFVETWLNGEGRLPSNCSKQFKVYNVQNVTISPINVEFLQTQDHSKWAVSDGLNWICIGDINRMVEHQKLRGGGTVCLNHNYLADNYRRSVAAIEKCHN